MNEVVERIRKKYPEYDSVPDAKLTRLVGEKYPQYLDREDFKADFDAIKEKRDALFAERRQPVTALSREDEEGSMMEPMAPTVQVPKEWEKNQKRAELLKERAAVPSGDGGIIMADIGERIAYNLSQIPAAVIQAPSLLVALPYEIDRALGLVPKNSPNPASVPVVSPEQARSAMFGSSRHPGTAVEGAKQFASELASSFTSPEMAGALVATGGGAAAAKTAGAAFSADMISHLPEQIQAYLHEKENGDLESQTKVALNIAASVGFPIAIAKGMGKTPPPVGPVGGNANFLAGLERAGAPLTARALARAMDEKSALPPEAKVVVAEIPPVRAEDFIEPTAPREGPVLEADEGPMKKVVGVEEFVEPKKEPTVAQPETVETLNFVRQLTEEGFAETKPLGESAMLTWERAVANGKNGELPVEYWVKGITDAQVTFDPDGRSATFHIAGYTADLKIAYETVTVTVTDDGAIRMVASGGREPALLKAAVAVTERVLRGPDLQKPPPVAKQSLTTETPVEVRGEAKAEAKPVTPQQQIRLDAKEFDDSLGPFGYNKDPTLDSAKHSGQSVTARVKQSADRKSARAKAFSELRAQGLDPAKPADRAAMLPKLKAYVEKFQNFEQNAESRPVNTLNEGDTFTIIGEPHKVLRVDADTGEVMIQGRSMKRLNDANSIKIDPGSYVKVEQSGEFVPPEKTIPKLREKENQGDIMAKQSVDLSLEGEKIVDAAKVAKEKADAEKAKQEAADWQAKNQPELPMEGKIPLGANRPKVIDSKLRGLSESDFDSLFRKVTAEVDRLEKKMDDGELSVTERESLAKAQDAYSAAELERYRRNISDTIPPDLMRELLKVIDLYPERASLILEELKRQNVSLEQLLSETRLRSPDEAEVFRAKLEKVSALGKPKLAKWTSATAELGGEFYAGIPNPIAVAKSVASLAKHAAGKLSPHVKRGADYVADLADEIMHAGKMTEYRTAVLNWSAKLQRSFGEASDAQREIQSKVPNKVRREGITNWIQAAGDSTTLTARRDASTNPKLRAGYQAALDLTPEEIAVAGDVKAAYDAFGVRGQSHGVLNSFLDDYVTQIWNRNKGPATGSSRTLRDKFRFSKARTFDTFFDGEQAGYVPKTKDISELLPVYLHEMNSVIAARQLAKELHKATATDGEPMVQMRGSGTPVDGPSGQATLIMPKASKPGAVHYRVLENQPALHDWIWASKDMDGKPIFLKADMALHPEAYDKLKSVLGRSAIREWYDTRTSLTANIPRYIAKGIDLANAETKRTMLGFFAPFHQVQEGTHAVGHRINPFFGIPKIDLVGNARQLDAARHGLMLLPDRASANQFMEGFRVSGLVSKIPVLGPLADHYSHYLFHEYIPGLKFKTYEAIFERNQKVYAKDITSGKATLADVKHLSSEQANAAYGHLNYADLGRNPTIQHIAQLGLLAPDFLEARGRFAGQAAKGVTGSKVGREQLIALATLAIAQATLAWTASKLTGGGWDEKNPFEFHVGTRKYTMRSVPEDIVRGVIDPRAFWHNRISPLIGKGIVQGISGTDWRGQKVTLGETAKELAAQPIPLTLRSVTRTNRSSLAWWEQLASAAGIKISRYNPRQELNDLHRDWLKKNPDPEIREDFERGQKATYPVSAYSDLDNALRDRNDDTAMEAISKLRESGRKDADILKRMRPGTAAGLPKTLFHETRKMESDFVATLDSKGKALYERAKEDRIAQYSYFLELWNKQK